MRNLLALVAAMLVVPLNAGEKQAKPDSIIGAWEVVSATFNGNETVSLKGRKLVFNEKQFTTYDGDKPGRSLAYGLDQKADPKQIDIQRGDDDSKALGIYAIDKDELKLCYAEPGADRPKKMESPAGDKLFLLVLKRVKAD